MTPLTYFAAETTEASSDIFTALGIDWKLLIIQIVAFLILVVLLGKFVYPWLMKSVDERQANIEAATKAAAEAKEAVEENQEHVAALLAEARKEAAEIVSTAKTESAEIVAASESKAKNVAEKIIADAQDQLQKDIAKARVDLHNEALELVTLATGKVVAEAHSKAADKALIAKALKEVK